MSRHSRVREQESVRLSTAVTSVSRHSDHVVVSTRTGEPERFDAVVIATHSDQALALLADPSDRERELLEAIPYQHNEAVLHTDRSLLPRRRRAWASWNYHLRADAGGSCTVTYHMNRLQSLRAEQEFCVTLNRTATIDPERIIRTIDVFAPRLHPRGHRGAIAPRGHQRAQSHALLRRLLGMGFPRGRRQTAPLRVAREIGARRPEPVSV